MRRRCWPAMLVTVLMSVLAPAEEYTYVDLVKRLTDLERLAVLPEAGETTRQWSSYDRRSRYDADTGAYLDWDSNGDAYGCIRQEEDGRLVMAEMAGPGCIWCIWTALAKEGHVRIFLDGSPEPVVDLPFSGYFDGANAPFTRPALVYEAARGKNCYVPIPYQQSCRIVADKGWGEYYRISYSTFPPGTRVPTFSRDLTQAASRALDAANETLFGPMSALPSPPEEVIEEHTVTIPPGEARRILEIEGPRAITAVEMRCDVPAGPEGRVPLRALTLQMTWDDDALPAVWCPLGDFFGTGPGANPYRSFPAGLGKDGWWRSRWYMPFADKALMRVGNDGESPRSVTFRVRHCPLKRPIDRLGRFHAKWHPDALLPTAPGRAIDWPILKTRGRGRFCGVMLHVWNPRGHWWGEGDEKFFVDGERFPSFYGTGSEDYFGYAWGDPTLFSRPYHSQSLSSGNLGHVSVNRWHVTDSVPFQRSFEACIEKYRPNSRPTLYDCTAYWYLEPGGGDPYQPVPLAQRVHWPEVEFPRIEGRIEGEDMEIIAVTGGRVEPHTLGGYFHTWPNDEAHLRWIDGRPGDRLSLGFVVKAAGRYALTLQLTQAREYGSVQILFDGNRIGAPVDCYDPQISPEEPVDLGVRRLASGPHTLTLEITGAHADAVKRHAAGVDFLRLDAVSSPE